MPDGFRLEVTEFIDRTQWRWILKDSGGAFLADHEVRLDPDDAWLEASTDLKDYVSWHSAPDNRLADEARIVADIGNWIGTYVFGPAISRALLKHRPSVIQINFPEGAQTLAYLPLETARIDGRSLADLDISLVLRPVAEDDVIPAAAQATDQLRVLGLFSLPEGGTALNLRRERQSLVTLITRLAATGRSADVKVLQYGVTRHKLRDILEDGKGWDVIHIAGHGTPGQLTLETADGHPDHIDAEALADLLDFARDRVRLVTVSACWSAARATAEPRRLLGLPSLEDHPERSPSDLPTVPALGNTATVLARRLGCAVLAMRFPIGDEFAIGLAAQLYDRLFAKGQSLPRAVTRTLRSLSETAADRRFSALSMAAPAIFGAEAAGLTFEAPTRTDSVSYATENLKMVDFPSQPDRFVGRTRVMARASEALATESGIPGVLLYGMPGGGKTACAIELAYTHEEAFAKLIWFKAPDEGAAIDGSLASFARALEQYLEGFQMSHVLADDQKLASFLPRLTELMRRNRILLVLDNAETLLTATGEWRDGHWGQVIDAITSHTGLGRLIMTTRRVPVKELRLRVEPVDALTPDETLLLIRDLPELRALIWDNIPDLSLNAARDLAIRVLNVAQGHPKLLELADGQAGHPKRLAALVQSGGQVWQERGEIPRGFFVTGESSVSSDDYLSVMTAWTSTVTDSLSSGERDLFWCLCCLEEPDRKRFVIDYVWDRLRTQLGRDGSTLSLDHALTALHACGLVSIFEDIDEKRESYAIHPGIAAAGRDQAEQEFRKEVDNQAAGIWEIVFLQATGENFLKEIGIDDNYYASTGLAVHAGLAAVPYLIRQQGWEEAHTVLGKSFALDPSQTNAAAMLPAAQSIARHYPHATFTLTQILTVLNPRDGESQLRTFFDDAIARSDHSAAASAASRLAYICREDGRLSEALNFNQQAAEHYQKVEDNPWSQLKINVQRLQIAIEMGNAIQVFGEFQKLRQHMETLPDLADNWDTREALFNAGYAAAVELGRWQDAVDFNTIIAASMRDRDAPESSAQRIFFNQCGPWIRLGKIDDALKMLKDCLHYFHGANNAEMIAKTLFALSDAEEELGHYEAANRFSHDALRYSYSLRNISDIATCYHNLGNRLSRHTPAKPATALACHLTAALINYSIERQDSFLNSGHAAADDVRRFGDAAKIPTDIDSMCQHIEDIPGTDPARLISELIPEPSLANDMLQLLAARIQEMGKDQPQLPSEDKQG